MKTSYRLFRIITIALMPAILCIGGCISAFAKEKEYDDYQVTNCRWEVAEDGHIYALWDKPAKVSSFGVSVYYYMDEDCTEKKTALSYKKVNSTKLDLTETIISKGAYIYYFKVRPLTGGNLSNIDESGLLPVTSEMITKAKALYKKTTVKENGVMNNFVLNVKEAGDPGTVRSFSIRDNNYAKVSDIVFSKPEEQWTVGEAVTVKVTYTARDGYAFSDDTVFQCKKAKIISSTGDDRSRSFVIEYVPKMKLLPVEGVYLNRDGILSWNIVDKAGRYNIQFFYAGEKEASKIKSTTSMDISEYVDDIQGAEDLVVRVFAIGSQGTTDYYLSSEAAELQVCSENLYEGEFRQNHEPPLYNDGGKVNGWTKISGKWFIFVDGEAVCDTLWTDPADGNTYYFGKHGVMQTGKVTVGDKTYTFNDGTETALPLGAMKK